MHQLGNDHRPLLGIAAISAYVGHHLLAAMRIVGFPDGLGLSLLQSEGSAFRARLEARIMLPVFLHHNLVPFGAAVWRVLQCLQPVLQGVDVRQDETAVFP